MKTNLFSKALAISLEGDEGTGQSVSSVEVAENEVENIEAQTDVEETAAITSEIEEISDHIEEAVDEGERLDETIVQGEQVLAENEGGDVPEEVVAVSQEALKEAILLLAGREYMRQAVPSLESYETNLQKLKISLESAKDFAANVWEKIKELFAKFMIMIKKFGMKISTMSNKGAKQAEALVKLFKVRTTIDPEKVTDEFKEKLMKAYPVVFYHGQFGEFLKTGLGGSAKGDGEILKEIGEVIKTLTDGGKFVENKSAITLLKGFGITPDDLIDDEVVSLAIVGRSSLTYITSNGVSHAVNVNLDASSVDVRDITTTGDNLAKIASDLKVQFGHQKNLVNSGGSVIDKAVKEIDKMRNNELKNALDYKEKADIRKRANILMKFSTKAVYTMLNARNQSLHGVLAVLGLLSHVYQKDSGK